MKVTCDVDSRLPESIRTKSEWRAAVLLSAYSDVIRDVRIVVRSPPDDGTVTAIGCLVWVRLGLRDWIIEVGNSESASDSVSLAIDKAAASVVQYSRRRSSECTGQSSPRQRSILILDSRNPLDTVSQLRLSQ